jgi:hypothetical protein
MRTLILAITTHILLAAMPAAAGVPTSISAQGKLTDGSDNPITGSQNFVFKLFDAEIAGTEIWPAGAGENQVLNSDASGLWIASVGAVIPLTDAVFADTVRWLEITVNGTTLPRVRLITGPFAHRVATVDGASGGTITSKVSIGPGHTNTGADAFVAGASNEVAADNATIGGGYDHYIDGSALAGTIAGGYSNWISQQFGTVGGGNDNTASDTASTAAGGRQNHAAGAYAFIGGGQSNSTLGAHSTIAGGKSNSTGANAAAVGGGESNYGGGQYSTVSGGYFNGASGSYATVAGGRENSAAGDYSFAAGRAARALATGTFVWADATGVINESNTSNSFNIRAANGFNMVANSSSYGSYFNNIGIGDGIRAYSATSQGVNWATIYATNFGSGSGIWATSSTGYAGYFVGPVNVTGAIVKGGGGFKIDHPLDPENKFLYHSFVESPDMKNLYDGVSILDEKGEAWVELPEWFEALNRDFRYQLTCIGGYSPVYIADKLAGNRFRIAGGAPGMEVSWQVTGTRQDAFANSNRIPVEEAKQGEEIGRYIHPTSFGKSKELGIDYEASKR